MRGYTGTIAGVRFEDGRPAEGSAPADPGRTVQALLGYARRHGLVIDDDGERLMVPEQGDPGPADPRKIGTDGDGIEPVGTKLRDAAVDPEPGDFLPPTNAGEANPHGPDVVAPEIHASQGVRPIKGGPVHVGDPGAQQVAETAHAAAFTGVEVTAGSVNAPERPNNSAKVGEWRTYAKAIDPGRADDIDATPKGELIERYGSAEAVEQIVDAGESGEPVGTDVAGDELGSDALEGGPVEVDETTEKSGDKLGHEG